MLSLDFYHPFWCNCSVLSVLRIRFNFSQTSSVSSLTLDVFILRLLKKRVWLNSTAWVNVGDVTADRLLISLCRNFMCLYSRSSVSSCDSVVLTLWFWFKQKKKTPVPMWRLQILKRGLQLRSLSCTQLYLHHRHLHLQTWKSDHV